MTKKIVSSTIWAVLAILLTTTTGQAQTGTFNYNHFAKKNYYFGITLGYNQSFYHVAPHTSLALNDSVNVIESVRGPGFNLGIVTNIKLGKNFDFRFLLPTLSFADRRLTYQMRTGETLERQVESVFLEFPIHFRYKSKPYKDTRIFVVAGAKYSMDLASNSRTRQADNLVRINRHDFVAEVGVGFQIFFPYFILSPELKFSYGLRNIFERNPDLIYSSPLERLFSRGLTVSFHFEG